MNWLKIKRLDKDLPLPNYQREGDAGIDLHTKEDIYIEPKGSAKVSFGIKAEIPKGCFGLVTTRSGIGFKFGTEARLGIIDETFRGEWVGKFYNYSNEPVHFYKGDRVAQVVIIPYFRCIVQETDELNQTERGENGFGSSGMK